MKALITGGRGHIGWHLVKHLKEQGHDVVAIDNLFHPCLAPDNGSKYADIRYSRQLEPFIEWCDVVFHLAAQIHVDYSIDYPEETMDINIGGTLNVLELATKYDKKLIFASTSEVYGSSKCDMMDESHPLDCQSPYAASKVAGDRLCKVYYDTFSSKTIILRNFNVFGEWQKSDSYGSVIAKFTRAALLGDPLYIYGDGQQERDYMHVSDAVSMYDLCSRLEHYGTPINMGTGKTVKIRELADIITRITKSDSRIEHIEPRPGEVQRLCCDNSKAKSLGLESKTDLERDLSHYIKWYAKNQLASDRSR